MEILEVKYALDTFYFLVMGALVMWMAAGFTMLEAGLVRAKNTAEILTKNVGLYSIACIMYMLCGYGIMYGDGDGIIPGISMLTATRPPFASVRLLRVKDGSEIRQFESAVPAYRVAFLPTGKHFVTCSPGQDAQLCVWDVVSGEQVAATKLDDNYLSLAVVPDGRRIVGAGGMAWLHRAGTDLDVHLWQLPESVWPAAASKDE